MYNSFLLSCCCRNELGAHLNSTNRKLILKMIARTLTRLPFLSCGLCKEGRLHGLVDAAVGFPEFPVLFEEDRRKSQAILVETLLLMYTVDLNTGFENWKFYGNY